jgi:ABC-type uncharacterized transport system fused permease/ATPase subunit
MASTTVKLSVETRDRLLAYGGETYEATIIEALDALDAERFWTQADDAAAWRRTLSTDDRDRLAARDSVIDAAFDGIE